MRKSTLKHSSVYPDFMTIITRRFLIHGVPKKSGIYYLWGGGWLHMLFERQGPTVSVLIFETQNFAFKANSIFIDNYAKPLIVTNWPVGIISSTI